MRRTGSHIAAAAFTAATVVLSSALLVSEAFAFSVRIGSFHITIGSHWHRHHHHFAARQRPAVPAHPAIVRGAASGLFYPQLALPDVLANVFSSSSAWPFGYRNIVQAAFTRQESRDAKLCDPQSDLADRFLAPLDAALALTDVQSQLVDKLGSALDAAQKSLVKSCPTAVPSTPAARLQLMDGQVGQLAAALGGVRQPLQNFQRALTDEQLARFALMIAAPAANSAGHQSGDVGPGCGDDVSAATERAVALIDHAVAPTPAQRNALDAFRNDLGNAANDLQSDCAAPMPPTELGRLGMVETRLDATRRAARAIEAALTKLGVALNDEQRAKLDAASLAAP